MKGRVLVLNGLMVVGPFWQLNNNLLDQGKTDFKVFNAIGRPLGTFSIILIFEKL
jgi:hypothetical protein